MDKRRRKKASRSTKQLIFLLTAVIVVGLLLLTLFGASVSPNSPSQSSKVFRENNLKAGEKVILKKPKKLIDGKKVAVAITVTKDGPYLDGAAVLVQSVIETHSELEMEMVAIVHPGVVTTRKALEAIGFRVVEFEPPIYASEIEGQHLRETIDNTGCCGSLELLKLRAYELEEYHRVLLLDMDSMLIKNIDHLFLEDDGISLQFTWDHAMDSKRSKAPPVQGGFLLLRPSKQVYRQLIDIVREGDFRPGTGWKGQNIGWCWGGQTVQGLLAYYYTMENKSGKHLDYCLYNAMDTTPEKCAHVVPEMVYTAHFTVCQKPWECHRGREGLCRYLHTHWWEIRQNLEADHGLKPTPQCCGGGRCPGRRYSKLPLPFQEPVWQN